MKTWYIYLLPNVPKVGMTTNLKKRIYYNKWLGHDTTGWSILEKVEGTRPDALKVERKHQLLYNCVDAPGFKSKDVPKTGLRAKGMPGTGLNTKGLSRGPATGGNAKGSKKPIKRGTCPVCGEESTLNVINRYHGKLGEKCTKA